jgi:hypothetical protein
MGQEDCVAPTVGWTGELNSLLDLLTSLHLPCVSFHELPNPHPTRARCQYVISSISFRGTSGFGCAPHHHHLIRRSEGATSGKLHQLAVI